MLTNNQQRALQAAHGLAVVYRDLAEQMLGIADALDRAGACDSVEIPTLVDPSRFIHAMRTAMVLEYLKGDR